MKKTQSNTIVEVQFRVFQGQVLAVFPYIIENINSVSCYMHVGQHSKCNWDINNFSKQATPSQYKYLLIELKEIYGNDNLKVITRRNHTKYLKTYWAWKKESK